MFLQVGVDARDGHADPPVALGHRAPENRRRQNDQRHRQQHHQREPRAHAEHDGHNQRQHQHIAENGHQTGSEQVVEHVYVRGDARHQPAHRVAVVESQIQPLQMLHELLAQVEHGKLAGVLHQIGLSEFANERPRQPGQVQQPDPRQAGVGVGGKKSVERGAQTRRVGPQIGVNRNLGEQRSQHLQHRLYRQKRQRTRHQRTVGTHVPQQTAHQARIVCLAEDFLFHLFPV